MLLITLLIWLVVDFSITKIHGSRGFSQFFETSQIEGRKNRSNFKGVFGSWLDEFSGKVTIEKMGERASSLPKNCANSKNKILFLGDSALAGFEVNDNQTFVSIFNKSCSEHSSLGINFGVRAHDTHAVLGTYIRVKDKIEHQRVIYFMALNDFDENLNPNTYENMSKRFGRRFDGKVYPPSNEFNFKIYAYLRQFVGDNLSTTTHAIVMMRPFFEQFKNNSQKQVFSSSNPEQSYEILSMKVETAIDLIKELQQLTSRENAILTIIPVPCVFDATNCKKQETLQRLLKSKIQSELKKTEFIELDIQMLKILNNDGFTLRKMHWNGDYHFSVYGHSVIGKILSENF